MNLRPSGYEPDELPDCSTPRQYLINYMHIFIKYTLSFGISIPNGWRRIRTTEAICSRFTVCPLWPLGNPSKISHIQLYDIVLISQYKADDRTRTDNLLITNQLLCQLSHIGLVSSPSFGENGAYRARTCDPLLVRQMLSQLS